MNKRKIHYGVPGQSRHCVSWQVGDRYPGVESTTDLSKVTCKRCLRGRR